MSAKSSARATELVSAELREFALALKENGDAFLRGDDDAVHEFRVTTRRLRSVLASFEPLLDAAAGRHLRAELKWLASALGLARDTEVIRLRLAAQADIADLNRKLGEDHRAALARVVVMLGTPRYRLLLRALHRLGGSRPDVAKKSHSANGKLIKLIRKDLKRLRNSVRRFWKTSTPTEHDLALHVVRKNSKRLRYTCECAAPATGKSERRLGRAAQKLQEILGEHQDSVALCEWLAKSSCVEASGGAVNALLSAEREASRTSEKRFRAAWRAFPRSL
ncbi:MAG: CHAD domain-containing protein [Microbacteriaceae bacterium]|nr:CHAD domain-containing protein [Microbacteriaceae bacterium]